MDFGLHIVVLVFFIAAFVPVQWLIIWMCAKIVDAPNRGPGDAFKLDLIYPCSPRFLASGAPA